MMSRDAFQLRITVTIIGLLAGAITMYLVVRLTESVTRLSFLGAAWWGIRGNVVGLTIPTTIIVLLTALMFAASTNLLLTMAFAEGRGVVVMGHSREELLVVEPAYPEKGIQRILETNTNADTPGGYPGQSFNETGTTRVILTYPGDPSYEITVLPGFVYALLWILTGFMIIFSAGLCLFLLTEYASSLKHSAIVRGGNDLMQAFKQNTRLGAGLWVVVLTTALFVLSAVSVHFSRKFDPLHEEVELYRRRVAATIFETVRPGDELEGTVVAKNGFRMDGTGYVAYEVELPEIADAPLYVNVTIVAIDDPASLSRQTQPAHLDVLDASPPDSSEPTEESEFYSVEFHRSHKMIDPGWAAGDPVRVRVTDELGIEPIDNAVPGGS